MDVRRTCTEFLEAASEFYKVSECGIRVLAARPLRVREHWSTELFGDYDPKTMLIRLWMRTAVRKEITSYGTFLSTLCHEFCHHLDFQRFGFSDSWHTRGFYERAAALYHYARGTPPKRLFWVPIVGGRCRIDRPRTNRGCLRRRCLPSRGRARPNRVPCASGAHVHSTTDAAHASNAPAHCAIPGARDLRSCCAIRVFGLPRGVHVLRERLDADIGRGFLPEGAALRRKAEPLRE